MGYHEEDNTLRELNAQQAKQFATERGPEKLFTIGEEVQVKGVMFRVENCGGNMLTLAPIRAVATNQAQQPADPVPA